MSLAVSLSIRSIANHERDHKGQHELAGILDGAADEIERLDAALSWIEDQDPQIVDAARVKFSLR